MQVDILYDEVLVNVSRLLACEPLQWSDEGSCLIDFDCYSLILIADSQEGQLAAVAIFDELMGSVTQSVFSDALRHNFQAIQRKLPQFSLDPEGGCICLSNKIAVSEPSGKVTDFVEEILYYAEKYTSENQFNR